MLNSLLQRLMARQDVGHAEMAAAMGHIMDGDVSPAATAAFLVALHMKGETPSELAGAAEAMRARMHPLRTHRSALVDTCGTGGSGSGAFNISTATAFVLAADGLAVAKHGNRAVSSKSGSADVLAALGVNIDAEAPIVEACLDELGIGFLYAPRWHPAMRHVAPVRRELGVRTIFNVLGPLTNPAGAKRQVLGVYARHWLVPLANVLKALGSERACVVHGEDGLDELTVCGTTHVAEWTGSEVHEYELTPEALGLPRAPPGSLRGGDAPSNAERMRALLTGAELHTPMADAVCLNAAAALYVSGRVQSLREGLSRARKHLAAGRPAAVLEALAARSHAG